MEKKIPKEEEEIPGRNKLKVKSAVQFDNFGEDIEENYIKEFGRMRTRSMERTKDLQKIVLILVG